MKIHGHPQKTDYQADGSDWLPLSFQGHWRPGSGLPRTFPVVPVGLSIADPQIAHTHLDLTVPLYGEITGPLTIKGTLKLFHTAGKVGYLISPLNQIRDLVWADTGTATPPDLTGDPMGVKQWNFSFVYDPTRLNNLFPPSPSTPPHGWFLFQLAAKTVYANGDSNIAVALVSYYSMMDPTQPELPWSGSGPAVGAGCAPNTLRRPELNKYGNQMGELFSQFVGMIPLAPIQTPWNTAGFFYAYAALEGVADGFKFPDGTLSLRRDVDIHNGKPGVDIVPPQHFQGNAQFSPTPLVLDPAVIGPGTHNIVAFWQEPDGQGNDATALFVFPLTVGAGGPPPPPPVTVPAPNVVGMTQPAATTALQAVGLTVGMVMPASDPKVLAGSVVTQSPLAGVSVPLGDGVMLTVSTGPVIVPPPADVWVVMKTPPVFMQLISNGKPLDRFRICDPAEPMTDPANCPEIVTKP